MERAIVVAKAIGPKTAVEDPVMAQEQGQIFKGRLTRGHFWDDHLIPLLLQQGACS